MSFCIGHSVCRKCGKPLTLFEGWICLECEKAEQEPCEDSNANQHNSNALNDVIQHTNALEGDAISRQAVLDIDFHKLILTTAKPAEMIRQKIEQLPSVNPQERIGHWIRWYEQKENDWYIENIPHCKCSECGKEYDPHSSQFIKFCNECGARMQEVEE